MPVLYFFESIRTPSLDSVMSILTHFGEETVFLAVAVTFFWCIDKREGYYLLSVGFIGTVINQFLKITCRISRPWVKDPNFTIIESARAQATGYSFPSGHTQSATGIFSSIAIWNKNKIIKTICFILIVAVAITRMYLGVHTPYDVLVSLVIAFVISIVLYPVFKKGSERTIWTLWLVMAAISLFFVLFVKLYPFPQNVEADNLASAIKNSNSIFGASIGIIIVYFVDSRYLRFKTQAAWWAQILKTIGGIFLLLLVKTFLKAPLYALLGEEMGQAARYFILVISAGIIWPYFFRFFKNKQKVGSNMHNIGHGE